MAGFTVLWSPRPVGLRGGAGLARVSSKMPDTKDAVPKKLWMMWLQGLDSAPPVVRACYRSWRALHPDWEFVFLDKTNFREYVDVEAVLARQPHLESPALSDLVRINLLARHGGVWVDATCFCLTPLSEWLPEHTETGFFAFYAPQKNRLLDIWFLASAPGNLLTARWAELVNGYLLGTPGLARRPKTSRWFGWLNRDTRTTRYWFFWLPKTVFRVYPYHWPPYLFTELVRRDPEGRRLWEGTKKVRAEVPLRLYRAGLLTPLTDELRGEIDRRDFPLYKLTWKRREQAKHGEDGAQVSVLDYLLASGAAGSGQNTQTGG